MNPKYMWDKLAVKTLLVVGTVVLASLWVITLSKNDEFLEKSAYAAQKPSEHQLKGSKGASISVNLHGSTPSMAWSPDGKHLAFNAAFEYFGFRNEYQQHKAKLGVFIADVKKGKINRISTQQGFHPLWLSKNKLAWGNSPYEKEPEGLYTAELKKAGKTRIKRVGRYKGVYHTLAGKKGGIAMFSGFPEYKRWVKVNPKTGTMKQIKFSTKRRQKKGKSQNPDSKNSWIRPAGHFDEQCKQKAGKVSVNVDNKDGTIYLTTSNATIEMDHKSYMFYNYGRKNCAVDKKLCGPMRACISPKGRYLAYFGPKTGKASYTLHIVPVPK